MMSKVDQEGQLNMNYNLMLRIKELEARLQIFDMFKVFMIQLFNQANPAVPVNQCNLLAFYAITTFEEVKASMTFLHQYGQDYDLENLQ
jgi:hypothetical protein